MKKLSTIILLCTLMFTDLSAQDAPSPLGFIPSSYYTISWNTTFTTGDFNKWILNPSPAGFDIGGRYHLTKGIYAGFNMSWQRVSQIFGYETFYKEDGSAITATHYRFTWMVPFQAALAYHLFPEKTITPYASLGIGGDYMEHHLLVQEYDIYKTKWDFSLTPEIGAIAKFGNFSNWGALVAFNYKWTTNNIEFENNVSSKNLQMLNLKVGLVLIVR